MTDALLLLSQFNAESPLPTFFELQASAHLSTILRDLFVFAHRAAVSAFPASLAPSGPYSEEIFYILYSYLEWSSLRTSDASFTEKFFGLTRAAIRNTQSRSLLWPMDMSRSRAADATQTAFSGSAALEFGPISRNLRLWSLAQLTLIPYAVSRLEAAFDYYTSDSQDTVDERRDAVRRLRDWRQQQRRNGRIKGIAAALCVAAWRLYVQLLVRLFPPLRLVANVAKFSFLLAYALERTPYFTPLNQWLSMGVRRMTQVDYARIQRGPARTGVLGRQATIVASILLSAAFTYFRFRSWNAREGGESPTMRLARTGVAGLSDEGAAALGNPGASASSPPPPPSIPETEDQKQGKCVLCHGPLVNPAVNVVSGCVGCYACLQTYVTDHGQCPVTRQRTHAVHIRRLYES